MNGNIPDYIEGIPTSRKALGERKVLIANYYDELWRKLQKEKGVLAVYNDYLGVDVYVVKNESDKKTVFEASKHWKSTYAVKHLYTVISKACSPEGMQLFDSVKNGTQRKNGYKGIALLYYTFINEKLDYLNFSVKLTIGIKGDGKHIQYCVNKIEI